MGITREAELAAMILPFWVSSLGPITDTREVSLSVMINWLIIEGIMVLNA